MWQEDKKLMGFKDLESWILNTPKAILVLEAVGIHYVSQKEAAKMYASISQFQPTQNTTFDRVLTMFIQVT